MSVYSFLLTVHFEWGANLGLKAFTTPKLKELQWDKTRLEQPLSGTSAMRNFMRIRLAVMEKQWSRNVCAYNCTCSVGDLYPTTLSAHVTPNWKVL